MRNLTLALLCLLSLCFCSVAASAQAATPLAGPELRKRADQTSVSGPTVPHSYDNPQGASNLPPEASGEYQLGKPGDVIEIILSNNGLTGYISMLGRGDHDKDVPLTYFFDQTHLSDSTLSFSTKAVHGQWYSFDGTVLRGPAATRSKEGYYLLKGTLVLHNTERGDQSRNVALPLARSENG